MRFCAKGFNPNVLSRLCNSDRGLPTRPPVVRGESSSAQGYKWVLELFLRTLHHLEKVFHRLRFSLQVRVDPLVDFLTGERL